MTRAVEWTRYDDYIADEDDEVLVRTMIENERAVETIEDILAIPRLGFAFLGPADLSMSMSAGDPTADNADAVAGAIDRTLEACRAADIPIGRIRNDVSGARSAIEEGYQIVRIGGDISSIHETLGDRADDIRQG